MKKQSEIILPNRGRKFIYEYESIDLAKTFPEWKSPLLSVDYMFIQTYQKSIDAKRRLDEKEKEVEFHNTEMTNKWVELKKKQNEFLSDVENYNTFFLENEYKCQRIYEKVITEMEFQKKCEQNIFDLKKRVHCLKQLETEIKDWEYLKNVTNQIERFADVADLINYYVLLNSETRLQENLIYNLTENEQLHTQLLKSLKMKMNILCQQRGKSLEFKKDYQSKTNLLKECNEKLNQQKEQTNATNLENIYMNQACDNIFQKLSKWKRKHSLKLSEQEKLIFVENSINELKNAVQLIYKISYKDDLSNKSDCSHITSKRAI